MATGRRNADDDDDDDGLISTSVAQITFHWLLVIGHKVYI